MECLSSRREPEAPGGGRAKIENSSRRPPREFGQKRFLAVRRLLARKWGGLFWATSLEKIFGGTTTLAAAKGRLIRCTVPGSTPNCLAMTRTPGRQEPPGPTPTRCATCALPFRAAITQRTRIASEFDRSIFWISWSNATHLFCGAGHRCNVTDCQWGAFGLGPIFRGRPRSSTGERFSVKILRGLS